ncbi:Hypothetical protein ACGLYG10_2298 [Actinomyces glycerinitolerans]|uniref:Uncharacterized protein n=1 Tax=Actinomyces glycerinitolerans TaxID=1892869 RepID=A0A1M4S1E9_9ACTO|nr:Hypothetical protein ACGLYG10_2298 [Actinomyces glycerinitolerans]
MKAWYLRTMRDDPTRGVAGYQLDRQLSSSNVPPDVSSALSSIHRELPQLTSDISTASTPISLLTFLFHTGTQRWAVCLDGSGGDYGAAGTNQVALAPVGVGLPDVIRSVREAMRSSFPFLTEHSLATGLVTAQQSSKTGAPKIAHAGQALLLTIGTILAMDDDHRYVSLAYDSGGPVSALLQLSLVLPESLARMARWSTGYPFPKSRRSQRIITCPWPRELLERHGDVYDRALGRVSWAHAVSADAIPGPLHWYVDELAAGRRNREIDITLTRGVDRYQARIPWQGVIDLWVSAIAQYMPLSNQEVRDVIASASGSGVRASSHDPENVLSRWDVRAAQRALDIQPSQQAKLDAMNVMLHHADQRVSQSALALARGDISSHPTMVSAQTVAMLQGLAAPAALCGAPLESKIGFANKVVAEAKRAHPSDHSWGGAAEEWLGSLGVGADQLSVPLPLTPSRVVAMISDNDVLNDPEALAPFTEYVTVQRIDPPESMGLAVRIVEEVPDSLVPLLLLLMSQSPRGLTWQRLVSAMLPRPQQVTETVKFVEQVDRGLSKVGDGLISASESSSDGSSRVTRAHENNASVALRFALVEYLIDKRYVPELIGDPVREYPAYSSLPVVLLAFQHRRVLPAPHDSGLNHAVSGADSSSGRSPSRRASRYRRWQRYAIVLQILIAAVLCLLLLLR